MPLAALSMDGQLYHWVSGDIHQKRPCGALSTVVYMASLSHWLCETDEGRASGIGETAIWLRCMALFQLSVFLEDSYAALDLALRPLVDIYSHGKAAGLLPAEGTEWRRMPDSSLNVERGLVASLEALKQVAATLFLQPGRWIGRVCEELRQTDIKFNQPMLMHFDGNLYDQASAQPVGRNYSTIFADPHAVVIFTRKRVRYTDARSGDIVIALPGVAEALSYSGLKRVRQSWLGSLRLPLAVIFTTQTDLERLIHNPVPPEACWGCELM